MRSLMLLQSPETGKEEAHGPLLQPNSRTQRTLASLWPGREGSKAVAANSAGGRPSPPSSKRRSVLQGGAAQQGQRLAPIPHAKQNESITPQAKPVPF